MTLMGNPLLIETVRPDWIDYNGHMTDSAYAIVFSMAVERLIMELGIDAEFREKEQYSIYTLETHLCYLQEAHDGQELRVTIQLLDYDSKKMHVFFVMENSAGDRLATSEQMLMGMDMKERRSAPFPSFILSKIESLWGSHGDVVMPKEAGRNIGIRGK